MSSSDSEFIVVRQNVDPALPVTVGDIVTSYEVPGDVRAYYELPPHSGHTPELFHYQEDMLARWDPSEWGVRKVLRCSCRRRIAQVQFHLASQRLWVVMTAPEWVPPELRQDEIPPSESTGWALHGVAGEAPCEPDVAYCANCHKRWLILSFAERAELIPIRSATHNRPVTD